MKCKLYLRMALTAMTALFVATGCSDSGDEPTPGGGGAQDPLTFQLQVTDIAAGKATVAVKPSDATAMYYCGAMEKSKYDAFASDAEVLAASLKDIQALATANKMTVKAYLEMYGKKGEANCSVNTAASNTAHYAYVYGIKTDGTATSKIFKSEEFTSGGGGGGEFTLTINVTNITAMAATVGVTASDDTTPYYFAAIDEEFYQELGGTPATAIPTYLSSFWAYLQSQFPQLTLEDIIDQMKSLGDDSYDFEDLEPGMKYYAFAVTIDAQGVPTATAVIKEFTTLQGGGGTAPNYNMVVAAGDSKGASPDICITTGLNLVAGSVKVASAKIYTKATSEVETELAGGATYESLAKGGQAFSAEWLGYVNDEGGIALTTGNAQNPLKAGTSYTSIVIFIAADGSASVKHMAVSTTGGATGPLAMSMVAGDDKGANKTTTVTTTMKLTGKTAASAKIVIAPTSDIQAQITGGKTYEQIAEQYGQAFEASWVAALNGSGIKLTSGADVPLAPGTSYTAVLKVVDGTGAVIVGNASATTDSAGTTPTDAYKAWLGTWTVTSASSEIGKKPISFDVTFGQNVVNTSYKIVGWSISGWRNEATAAVVASLKGDGGFGIANQQAIGDLSDGVLTYLARYYDFGEGYLDYYLVTGNFEALSGVAGAAAGTANVTGGKITFKDDPNEYVVSSIEYFKKRTTDGKFSGYAAAEGYTDGDYPVGPYTMTKKSGSAAPAMSKSSVAAKATQLRGVGSVIAKEASAVANIPSFSSMLKMNTLGGMIGIQNALVIEKSESTVTDLKGKIFRF